MDHRAKGISKRRANRTDPVQQEIAVHGERLAVPGLIQAPRDEDHENPLGRIFSCAVLDAEPGHLARGVEGHAVDGMEGAEGRGELAGELGQGAEGGDGYVVQGGV